MRLREELAARPESEGGPTLSLEALDEMLAIAASSADVYEDSAADLSRDAIEAVREAYEVVIAPEKERVPPPTHRPLAPLCTPPARRRLHPSARIPRWSLWAG